MSYREEKKETHLEDRVRKAAAALYRVTDTLSDNEPLKWKLRNDAIELAETIVAVGQKGSIFGQNFYFLLLVSDRLVSKLSIAAAGGYISRINFQVLEQEYETIAELIFGNMSDMRKGQNILSDINIGHYKRHIKDIINDISLESTERNTSVETDSARDEVIGEKSKKTGNSPSSTSERHTRITTALIGKGWLQVAQIATLCGDGASIKTIQRDLIFLMQNGVIKSRGQRRWRAYALAEI